MSEEENFQSATEVASGTFWGLVGNGALKIVSFLYVIYVARAVSQNDVGLFYLAFSIIGLFGAWKTLGLPAALSRYIPFYEARGEHGKARGLFRHALALNAAVGVLLAASVWLAADFAGEAYQNPGLPEALRLLALYVFLDNILSTALGFLQGRADIKALQLVSNAQTIFKFALTVLLFQLYGANLSTLSTAFVLSFLLAIIVSAKFVYNRMADLPGGDGGITAFELAREIAPFGMMLTLISILWTVVSYSDRVVMGFFMPPAQANELIAVYSMAVVLALNMMVFPGTVGSIFLPAISRLVGKNNHEGIRKTMATAQRWILFITLPFAIVMIAFAPEMLSVFYGSQYGGGGTVMSIFCAGLLFSLFSYVFSLALAAMRLVSLELKIAAVVVLANIALCVVLIPAFGMEGAAMSAAAAFAISALLFAHYAWTRIGYSTPAEIYKLFALALLVCGILFFLKPVVALAAGAIPPFGGPEFRPYVAKIAYLLLLGAVSAFAFAAFGALSLLAKCLGKEDVTLMKHAARKMTAPQQVVSLAERIMLAGVSEKK